MNAQQSLVTILRIIEKYDNDISIDDRQLLADALIVLQNVVNTKEQFLPYYQAIQMNRLWS